MAQAKQAIEQNDYSARSIGAATKSDLKILIEWIKANPVKAAKFAKSYAIPAAGVVLAGPTVSLLPLGPFAPFLAILATSVASFRLRQNVVGGLCAMLHAGGLGIEGQVLSLCSFMSLSAAFGATEASFQARFSDIILAIAGVQAQLADFVVSMLAVLTNLPGVFRRIVRDSTATALVAAFQTFAVLHGLGWSGNMLEQKWRRLAELVREELKECKLMKVRWGQLSDLTSKMVSGNCLAKPITEDPAEQDLTEWETIDGDHSEHYSDGSVGYEEAHAQVLFDEVMFLIDGCEGLSTADWDDAIALLGVGHDNFEIVEKEEINGTASIDD